MADPRTDEYVRALSRMIDVPTVSDIAFPNEETFRTFRALLKELFPNVFRVFRYEEFDGAFLLSCVREGDPGAVLFMSHHDVVSANGEWVHEPFWAAVDGGALYGRGTLDTKGNLWAILTALEELIVGGVPFGKSLYIESSCNEETTSAGAYVVSRELQKRGVRFDFTMDEGGMIVYDPLGGADGTFAMVALGEKDCIDLKFIARSSGGHSSSPDSTSPLSRLSAFVTEVEKRNLFKPRLEDTLVESMRKLSAKMSGGLGFLFRYAKFYKPLLARVMTKVSPTAASMVKTTLCFTKAKGADEFNVIPTEAYFTGNIRLSHHDTKQDVLEKLGRIAKKYDIEIVELDPGYPSDVCDYRTEAFRFLEQQIGESFPGVITAPYLSTGASDSKFFNDLSDNVFRFAPFVVTNEQLDTIHAKEENITVSSLAPAVDFYKNMIRKL